MSASLKKLAEAHDCGVVALFATVEAHAAEFGQDEALAIGLIREAIGKHRDAINLLTAALPDRIERERRRIVEKPL